VAEIQIPVAAVLWDTLIGQPGVGVTLFAGDGVILFVNEHARIHRYRAPVEIIGRSIRSCFPPQLAECCMKIIARVHKSGRPIALREILYGRRVYTTFWAADVGSDPRVLGVHRRYDASLDGSSPIEVVDAEWIHLGALDVLTTTELEVLALVGQGLSVPAIARMQSRSPKTIENHKTSISGKLQVRGVVELAQLAAEAGLTVADARRKRVRAG
jgi:DNA-binding CsgD family transcriptional regulator